jgi:hypothetical protein
MMNMIRTIAITTRIMRYYRRKSFLRDLAPSLAAARV